MRVTAKVDYAVRALVELAAAEPGRPVKGEQLAAAQNIPLRFLENILSDLRHGGLVASQRGAEGGYWLAKPADQIVIADIIREVEGPLADVRGTRPDALEYTGPATAVRDVWIAVRANLRAVLEEVSLADVATGRLPDVVVELTSDPEAWKPH